MEKDRKMRHNIEKAKKEKLKILNNLSASCKNV